MKDAAGEEQRVTRSSPRCTYDFMGDSPHSAATSSTTNKRTKPKRNSSNIKKKEALRKKSSKESTKTSNKKSADKLSMVKNVTEKVETPKTRSQKPLTQRMMINVDNDRQGRRVKHIKPIAQPNLDDISPIISKDQSKTSSTKNTDNGQSKGGKRKLRSSDAKTDGIIESPAVSFIEPLVCSSDKHDSGLFLSPRKTMPRFSNGKTSTPANIEDRKKRKTTKKLPEKQIHRTETSTPIEVIKQRSYTGLKKPLAEISPVTRMETPTSDYGSMECSYSESPTPAKKGRAKRSSSPAFKLEDEDESASLSLNRSTDKMYINKKIKRKFQDSGRKSSSKMEEWADKVNSELEDIENFELSVEG